MTHVVTLALDLRRPEGRAAMRAYMDAIEAMGELTPAPPPPPPVDETGSPLTHRAVLYRAFGLDPTPPAATAAAEPAVAAEGDGPAPEPAAPPAPEDAQQQEGGERELAWTDALKREVWAMREAGVMPVEIAARVGMRATRVHSFITNVRKGRVRLPAAETRALVPVAPAAGAVALRDQARAVAQDAGMQAARLEEMARAEREKLVAKATMPEAYS